MRVRLAVMLCAIGLLLPSLVTADPVVTRPTGGWGGNGSWEPDTVYDDATLNWHSPTTTHTRLYFNAFHISARSVNPNSALIGTYTQTPFTSFAAILGVWVDCNDDGYVGLEDSALYEYAAILLDDDSYCPEDRSSPPPVHNDGETIREIMMVGPACGNPASPSSTCDLSDDNYFVDNETRVWGDTGLPDGEANGKCPRILIPNDPTSAPDVIAYADCLLVPTGRTAVHPPADLCETIVAGASICRASAPDPYALAFNCIPAGQYINATGAAVLDVTPFSLQIQHAELFDEEPLYYAGPPAPACAALSPAPEALAVYERAAGESALGKRSTDWDFKFVSTSSQGTAGLGALQSAGLAKVWQGMQTEMSLENRYLDIDTNGAAASAATYYTFYAEVGGATTDRRIALPGGAGKYVGPCVDHDSGVHGGWNCDRSLWYRDAQGVDRGKPWQVRLNQQFRLRDVDCYDGSTLPVGPSATYLAYEAGTPDTTCARPGSLGQWANYYLNALGAQVDANRNMIGDAYEQAYGLAWNTIEGTSDEPPIFDADYHGDTPRAGAITEFRWNTNPFVKDFDADGWWDADEIRYWKLNPDGIGTINWQDAFAMTYGLALRDPEASKNSDQTGEPNIRDNDSDNDGWDDWAEFATYRTFPEFYDSDCSMAPNGTTGPCTPPLYPSDEPREGEPGTGDHMNDSDEFSAWAAHSGYWQRDFDRDGILNNLLDPDADGDAVADGSEFKCARACTDAWDFDSDDDGLLDGDTITIGSADRRVNIFLRAGVAYDRLELAYKFYGELAAGTYPNAWDSDGDHLPDGWEVKHGLDPTTPNFPADSDADRLTDIAEYKYKCTGAPCESGPGVWWNGTNPRLVDTDGDELDDYTDALVAHNGSHTDARDADTDMDGLSDGSEFLAPNALLRSDPTLLDTDGDGLTDYQERVTYAAWGPSPTDPNTDGPDTGGGSADDVWSDFQEIIQYSTRPNNPDTDGDTLTDSSDPQPGTFNFGSQPVPPPPTQAARRSSTSRSSSARTATST